MSHLQQTPSISTTCAQDRSSERTWLRALKGRTLFSPTGLTVALMTGVAVTTALPTLGISLATAGIGAAAWRMWSISLSSLP